MLILAKITKCSRGTVPAGPVTTIRLSEVNTALRWLALTQVERSCCRAEHANGANPVRGLRINTDVVQITVTNPTGSVMMDAATDAQAANNKLLMMKDAVKTFLARPMRLERKMIAAKHALLIPLSTETLKGA